MARRGVAAHRARARRSASLARPRVGNARRGRRHRRVGRSRGAAAARSRASARSAAGSTLRSWLDRVPWLAELADEGGPVIVACSGGADSLALLALAAAAGVAVVAAHVDHGLRPGSDADFSIV